GRHPSLRAGPARPRPVPQALPAARGARPQAGADREGAGRQLHALCARGVGRLSLHPMKSLTVAFLAAALAVPALAQPVPKTPDGRPDLTGNWSNVSLTKLERPGSLKSLTLPEAEAKRLAANDPILRMKSDRGPIDPEAGPPAPGGSTGH